MNVKRVVVYAHFFLLLALSLPHQATADVSRVVVSASGYLGSYGDNNYYWAAAKLHGSFERADGSTGQYQVPIDLIYPDHKPNGIAVVDLVNSYSYDAMLEDQPPLHKRPIRRYGERIIGDYMWRNGYSYLGLQWSKMVTDVLGDDYGIIERGVDGYHVIADAAAFMRNPVPFEESSSKVLHDLQGAENTIGFGYSQPASLLWGLTKTGRNRRNDGSQVFDGILSADGPTGKACRILVDDSEIRQDPRKPTHPTFYSWQRCNEPLPGDVKFVGVITESLANFSLGFGSVVGVDSRSDDPNYRQYELAGVSHSSPVHIDLRRVGVHNQNYVNQYPFIKAAFHNLTRWVLFDEAPPPSSYIEGDLTPEGKFVFRRDDAGNVHGGVRLPHMESKIDGDLKGGAPLGVYSGLNLTRSATPHTSFYWDIAQLGGGTFTPFSSTELQKRYPSSSDYVQKVKRSADDLLRQRYILAEDHKTYLKEAKQWQVPLTN